MEFLKRYKDYLYYYFAEKNWGVRREYGPYVDAHQDEHLTKRWKHWWMLFRLNWHYRILRNNSLLYLETKNNNIYGKQNISKNKIKRKLPYFDGSESSSGKRISPVHIAMQLLQYDVISFDIFDTLILRPFEKPIDLFYILGKRLNMPEFYNLRINAEKQARDIAATKNGSREVNIYDIYDIIEQQTGLPKKLGVQSEFEAELDYCFANPYMKNIFEMMQEQNKTIIIVSDMYYPHDMMKKLLYKNGYRNYDKLYVSCDYACNKHGKGLYKYVLNDNKGKSIVHIGDNRISDVKCAQECGIKTIYYPNVNVMGEQYRADGMSDLIGSAYRGIVNAHLHNGVRMYGKYYEYGFIYGGLYVIGFCNWIYKKAKLQNVDKILFLSRDGKIYQNIFSSIFNDIPSEYFLWSRIANTKYTFERAKYLSFETAIRTRAGEKDIYTIGELLSSLEIESLADKLYKYNLSKDTIILNENIPLIEKFISENANSIIESYQLQMEYIKKYIKEKIGDAKSIAIIDVGWLGSGPMGIKYIINNLMELNCEVHCWQAAAVSSSAAKIEANILDNEIDAYLFSKEMNRNNYDTHTNTNKGLNHIFFEMFTQDTSPSYSGMSDTGSLKFTHPEIENYSYVRDIHKGIYDFAMIYSKTFKYDKYMYNISGYDAYLPFRMTIKDLKYFKNNMSDFVFKRTIGGNESTEILGDIIKKVMEN